VSISSDFLAGDSSQTAEDQPAPRKRGRPKGSRNRSTVDPLSVTPNPTSRNDAPAITAAPVIAVDYDALGKAAANLWFNGGTMLFGVDWQPDTAAGEHVVVKDAFRDYFQSQQIQRIPPDVQLFIVLGGYTLARAQKPTVKSKFVKGFQWVKSRMQRNREE
jgi:hypothetical protein